MLITLIADLATMSVASLTSMLVAPSHRNIATKLWTMSLSHESSDRAYDNK